MNVLFLKLWLSFITKFLPHGVPSRTKLYVLEPLVDLDDTKYSFIVTWIIYNDKVNHKRQYSFYRSIFNIIINFYSSSTVPNQFINHHKLTKANVDF